MPSTRPPEWQPNNYVVIGRGPEDRLEIRTFADKTRAQYTAMSWLVCGWAARVIDLKINSDSVYDGKYEAYVYNNLTSLPPELGISKYSPATVLPTVPFPIIPSDFNAWLVDLAGGSASPVIVPVPITSATFTGTNPTTQGNWSGDRPNSGFSIAAYTSSIPASVKNLIVPSLSAVWTKDTADIRALATNAGRIAAGWWTNTSMDFGITFADAATHKVSLYLLDWDGMGRKEKVEVINKATGDVLDSQIASAFQGGVYYIWDMRGDIIIRVTNLAGSNTNAVVSGIFIS